MFVVKSKIVINHDIDLVLKQYAQERDEIIDNYLPELIIEF